MINKEKIINYLNLERETIKNLDIEKINAVFNILDDCLKEGKNVYVFGNGGSGSTASHMTNDFNKAIFNDTDNVFNFKCLNDNIPTMLAIANDTDYSEIFRYQLINHISENDVIIAFSGSGNSKNIIKAVTYAKECKATIIGFTGYDGGKLKCLSDISIDSNIFNMEITEDIHLIIEHLLISMFYDVYGKKDYDKLILKKKIN